MESIRAGEQLKGDQRAGFAGRSYTMVAPKQSVWAVSFLIWHPIAHSTSCVYLPAQASDLLLHHLASEVGHADAVLRCWWYWQAQERMLAKEERYGQKIIIVQWMEVVSDNDIDCYLTNACSMSKKREKNPLFLS